MFLFVDNVNQDQTAQSPDSFVRGKQDLNLISGVAGLKPQFGQIFPLIIVIVAGCVFLIPLIIDQIFAKLISVRRMVFIIAMGIVPLLFEKTV